MKKLLLILGLVAMSLPAVAQVNIPDGIQLRPHLYYHIPNHGWNDTAETPDTDLKRYYWDGTGDDGYGLHFDDEDTLILITFDKNGVAHYHEEHVYKLQLAFQRQDPNAAFGTCYLYLVTPSVLAEFKLHNTVRNHHHK